MRPSFALRALSLAIGLSAFSLSGHAAIQFNCSDSLTREVGDALVLRCRGVLDVRGDGAGNPNDVLSHAGAIRLHGELGLSLDNLTLVAPTIELTSAQQVVAGNGLAVLAPGGVFVRVPARVQVGQNDTHEYAILDPNHIIAGLVGGDSHISVAAPRVVVPTDSMTQQTAGNYVVNGGGSIVVGGGITLAASNDPRVLPLVITAVPEPGTQALILVGLGALSLRLRRRG